MLTFRQVYVNVKAPTCTNMDLTFRQVYVNVKAPTCTNMDLTFRLLALVY